MIYLGELRSPFLMEIVAYTSPGCFYCDQLKQLFNRAKLEYTTHLCDTPDKKKKLLEEYAEAKSFPFVVIDGEVVGGLVDTAKYLVQKGLVSSKKS